MVEEAEAAGPFPSVAVEGLVYFGQVCRVEHEPLALVEQAGLHQNRELAGELVDEVVLTDPSDHGQAEGVLVGEGLVHNVAAVRAQEDHPAWMVLVVGYRQQVEAVRPLVDCREDLAWTVLVVVDRMQQVEAVLPLIDGQEVDYA